MTSALGYKLLTCRMQHKFVQTNRLMDIRFITYLCKSSDKKIDFLLYRATTSLNMKSATFSGIRLGNRRNVNFLKVH